MLSRDVAIVNGMVRTKDSIKTKDADKNLYIEKEGANYNGYVLGVSGDHPQYIMVRHGVAPEDLAKYARNNGLTITDLKTRDGGPGSGVAGHTSLENEADSHVLQHGYKGYLFSKNKNGGFTITGRPGSIYEKVVKNFNSGEEAKNYINKEDQEYERKLNRESSRFEREGNYDSKTKDENLKEKLIRLAEQAGDKEYADDIRNGKVPLSQSELVRRIDWYTTRTVGQ